MAHRFAELTFTPAVLAAQARLGSQAARMLADPRPRGQRLGEEEAAFIAARDSFYMATVSESGWPYVQHRGGPAGFLRVLDEGTLGFADFRGNRQYLSVGNLSRNDRVCLFLMDYPHRARLKVLGRAERVEDPEGLSRLALPGARAEGGFLIHVEAFDWNCPQHITERYTLAEVEAAVAPLRQRIAELEAALSVAQASS